MKGTRLRDSIRVPNRPRFMRFVGKGMDGCEALT